MSKEVWKPVAIPEFSEFYDISSTGRVFSHHTNKVLIPKKRKTGYLYVTLCNGIQRAVSIHRLVALSFIPNLDNKPTVNHKNEIKNDNRVENLEWATTAEQNSYGTRLERARENTDYSKRQIDYSSVAAKHDYKKLAKLNEKKVAVYKNGEYVGEYPSLKIACSMVGTNYSKASMVANGLRNQTGGYCFKWV